MANLEADIKVNGMTQGDLVRFLQNTVTLVNELKVDVDLNGAALAAVFTKMDSDSGVGDTNYVAVHGRAGSGAGIQAAAVAASDLALTKS